MPAHRYSSEGAAPDGGDVNPWGITFQRMFDMPGDSHLFATPQVLLADGWSRDGMDVVRETPTGLERRVPLYEAKMIHYFDHRWATYAGDSTDDEEGARDCTLAEKQDRDFEPSPRYFMPEREVMLRAARVPASLKRSLRDANPDRALKSLTEWLAGWRSERGEMLREAELIRVLGGTHPWRSILGMSPERFLMDPKTLATGREMQRETPLSDDYVAFLPQAPRDPIDVREALIQRKQPRWLMGWRDICRSTDERTVISSVFPKVGTGDKILLMHPQCSDSAKAVLLGMLTSLVSDFVARQKFGGTSFKYYYMKQVAALPPSAFSPEDLAFVTPRVQELTYTSHSMRAWAEDLGHSGPPFTWDDTRRALLRAELDAFYALKFSLSRDELRYVLDPSDVKGGDYPSQTYRGLKRNEERRFGEYRTRRLVLEAFDQLSSARIAASPIVLRPLAPAALRDGSWARSAQPQAGDVGAALSAILKTMGGPRPARDVRLAAALVLEPRLLVPLLHGQQALEWHRLIGSEADPLVGNVTAFATRNDAAWGTAVRNHRGNGRLIEDPQSGTWAPGAGLEAIDTVGWPDGRASFVWAALGSIDIGIAVNTLPHEIQQWVTNAAAA
jgi:hypothetical protein